MSVNRTMPTGLAHSKSGASGSAYVTYRRPQEAQRCVETVDGITWAGACTSETSLMTLSAAALKLRRGEQQPFIAAGIMQLNAHTLAANSPCSSAGG